MRKLTKPTLDAAAVFQTCISRIRDRALKRKLSAVARRVTLAARDYEAAAQQHALYTIPEHDRVGRAVTTAEMCAVYDGRMAKKGSAGRAFYDQLKAGAPQGRCPLCGQRTVSTLDHHLPKTSFPSLAVSPANLIPSCADCNKSKLAAVPRTAEDQTLHPYFDDVDGERWLAAKVDETLPATLTFHVVRCPSWDDVTDARVRNHFKTFSLGELYASHAAEELLNIRFQLRQLAAAGGPTEVRTHLTALAESREDYQLNSWQAATYRALSASSWYCSGGYG